MIKNCLKIKFRPRLPVGSRIPIPPRGKEIRAEPFAAAWQGGNVYAVAGAWIADFLEEAEPWPAGKTKDQIGCGLESCPF